MNDLFNEYLDEESVVKAKKILYAFERISDDLLILNDFNYISNVLQLSPMQEEYFRMFLRQGKDLTDLSADFDKLKYVLFGGIIDWKYVSELLGDSDEEV